MSEDDVDAAKFVHAMVTIFPMHAYTAAPRHQLFFGALLILVVVKFFAMCFTLLFLSLSSISFLLFLSLAESGFLQQAAHLVRTQVSFDAN